MDLLGTRQVDPVHQSPQTRAYGFFAKGTVPSSLIFTHLVCRVGGGALARWPPSAAQTACAGFPRAAFTKTHDLGCKQTATVKWASLTSVGLSRASSLLDRCCTGFSVGELTQLPH